MAVTEEQALKLVEEAGAIVFEHTEVFGVGLGPRLDLSGMVAPDGKLYLHVYMLTDTPLPPFSGLTLPVMTIVQTRSDSGFTSKVSARVKRADSNDWDKTESPTSDAVQHPLECGTRIASFRRTPVVAPGEKIEGEYDSDRLDYHSSKGTLGCFAKTLGENKICALTCQHVVNPPPFKYAKDPSLSPETAPGRWIYHPTAPPTPESYEDVQSVPLKEVEACCCCALRKQPIGRVHRASLAGTVAGRVEVDAALVALDPEGSAKSGYSNAVTGTGFSIASVGGKATHHLALEEILTSAYKVKKCGARTGLTHGIVTTMYFLDSPNQNAKGSNDTNRVEHAIIVRPDLSVKKTFTARDIVHHDGITDAFLAFGAQGDSGAVLLNEQNLVIALLSAERKRDVNRWEESEIQKDNPAADEEILFIADGYGNPIHLVETRLNCEVLGGPAGPIPAGNMTGVADLGWDGDPFIETASATARVLAAAPIRARAVLAPLTETASGTEFVEALLKFHWEVQELILTNPKVAAVWLANGGPALMGCVMQAPLSPQAALPTRIKTGRVIRREHLVAGKGDAETQAESRGGLPTPRGAEQVHQTAASDREFTKALSNILQVLRKHGSAPLGEAIDRFGPCLESMGGRELGEAVNSLR